MRRRKPREQGDEKAGRGRGVAMLMRRDLVQGADREAALRQMRVERRQAEGQGARRRGGAFQARQQAAQLVDDRGAVAALNGDGRRGDGRRGHGVRSPAFWEKGS
ncbi:MAG TPA: hypothetical protein VII40_08505 [Xanthobacteraceae bacterium]